MAKLTLAKVEAAIPKYDGNITDIARALGVSRNAIYDFIRRFPSCKEALDEARESEIDFVESEFKKLIRSGNVAAIIFYLKTKGKGRGYTTRSEITGADGSDIIVKVVRN